MESSNRPVVAYDIDSTVLGIPIVFAIKRPFDPDPEKWGDAPPVFYADELKYLADKSPDQLKKIAEVKSTFGYLCRVRK